MSHEQTDIPPEYRAAAQDYLESLPENERQAGLEIIEGFLGQFALFGETRMGQLEQAIFSDWSNLEQRLIEDFDTVRDLAEHFRNTGRSITMTSGTFDLTHIGHARYIEEARRHGDLIIIGIDADDKVKARKGDNRPLVPEDERYEMISHLRGNSILAPKHVDEEKWGLIGAVHPDTLIITEGMYQVHEIHQLEAKYCGEVVILEKQAETSTSAKIRLSNIALLSDLHPKLIEIHNNHIVRQNELNDEFTRDVDAVIEEYQ